MKFSYNVISRNIDSRCIVIICILNGCCDIFCPKFIFVFNKREGENECSSVSVFCRKFYSLLNSLICSVGINT